ncbi:MAG TPA: glycosyltransferase family 9 protein [Pirellulales bacterium]|nr:glycosyltransferase family 9 protein [Pirellulales bacterium]
MPERILLVQLNGLGDILHAFPAAAALRTARPEAHLAWAVDANYADLLSAQSWLDQVVVWDRRSLGGLVRMLGHLRRDSWEIAIDFQGRLRSGLVARLSRAHRRVGYLPSLEMAQVFYNECRPLESLNVHAVERNLALVAHLGPGGVSPLARPYLSQQPPREEHRPPWWPVLNAREKDVAAVDAWRRQRGYDPDRERLVVLNPNSRRSSHRWPAARFTQLARRLLNLRHVRVALAASAGASALCDEICEPLGDAIWRADGRFHPLALSVLLSKAAVVVSGDDSLLHLAVASGAGVVGLYGASDLVRRGPYAASASVLFAGVACSPCYSGTCLLAADPPLCMQEISVDRVFTAVVARLDQQAGAVRRSA